MTQKKTYFLLALIGVSAYVIKRSLIFLSQYWDFDETLLQAQTTGSVLGVDVSFSYLGMHIFWPYVICFCLLGYYYSRNADSEDAFYLAFRHSALARYSAHLLIPSLELLLHYFTISGLFLENLEKLLRFGSVQQPPYPPSLPERVAVLTIVFLVLVSLALSLYSQIKLNFFHRSSV